MDLSGRLQELQNEVNIMRVIPRILWMLNRLAVEIHTVTSPPGLFPKHPPFEGLLRPLYSSQADKMRSRQIFGIHPVYQETFLQIHKLHRQLRILRNYNSSKWNPWRKTTEEPIHMSIAEKSGDQSKTQI